MSFFSKPVSPHSPQKGTIKNSGRDEKKHTKNSHQLLRLPQQLPGQHHHARRAVPDLLVLHARDVYQDLRGRVVDVDRPQDRRAVVGDGDAASAADGLEDLVHPFRAQGRFHEVGDGHGADEGGLGRGGLVWFHVFFDL